MAHLMLIDNEAQAMREEVHKLFASYRLTIAGSGASGVELVRCDPPDVVLLDTHLRDRSGLEVFDRIRAFDARIPVIFTSMARNSRAAIEATKRGAFDYLYKPFDVPRLRRVVDDATQIAARMRVPAAPAADDTEIGSEDGMCGGCAAMLDVYKAIGRVAPQDVPVLITGESGTGKELVAHAIHQHSRRSNAPFLALNCAAIPAELLESELFGHEKGAFTGAERRRIGKFEQCTGGTVFLDEIGDMPLVLQAKILRFLQEQTFERVGGNETVRTDVRVIAATHRNLKTMVGAEKFRGDLYYRVGVFNVHLPPLRDRGEDLPLLVRHFVRRFSRELGREVSEVAPETLARLHQWHWPGNVRELQSVLKQTILNATGPVLLPGFLPELSASCASNSDGDSKCQLDALIRRQFVSGGGDVWAEVHRTVDEMMISAALEYTRGNRSDAARVLGISRQTMRMRFNSLGLKLSHLVEPHQGDAA